MRINYIPPRGSKKEKQTAWENIFGNITIGWKRKTTYSSNSNYKIKMFIPR